MTQERQMIQEDFLELMGFGRPTWRRQHPETKRINHLTMMTRKDSNNA